MIVVTGAAGFIGSNIVKALNDRGRGDVLAVDNLSDGRKMFNLADCEIMDYLDKERFIEAIVAGGYDQKIETIFHQGACSTTTEWDGRFMMENNYEYSKNLLHYSLDQKIPYIYASSASVYGGSSEFVEKRAVEKPLNVYAYSKFLFDQHVRRLGYTLDVKQGEGGFGKRYRLGKQLLQNQYFQAIVLPRSLKFALVPFFAKIPQRTGFRGEMRFGLLNDIRPFDKSKLDQTVKRFSFLGLERADDPMETFNPELTVSAENTQLCLSRLGLNQDRFTLALMPGAEFGPAKQWPSTHFSELIRRIDQAGTQAWLFGSEKESAAVQQIIDQAGGVGVILCGKTQLADAIDLIAAADVAVANDSGLMHLAVAAGTRVIAIYGSSSPLFTPPLTDNRVINWLELECSPCFQRECKFGHYDCLNKISAETVFQAMSDKKIKTFGRNYRY